MKELSVFIDESGDFGQYELDFFSSARNLKKAYLKALQKKQF